MGAERVDTDSAAINVWTHPWTHPAIRDESSLMGMFYAAWADENRLWKAEVEEGLSLEDLPEVLGELEKKAPGRGFTGDEGGREAPQKAFQWGFCGLCPAANSPSIPCPYQ